MMKDLNPYAIPFNGMLGRKQNEKSDATRSSFQRDRDRIIQSTAFRRLQGKTQVFVSGEGDHFRSRLTHTMEVAQISRDIARTLGLNEDLAECIALAHDLGHPPFGHAGEEALDAWMKTHGSHFEHNEQSLRIVTTLEYHSNAYLGLNLSTEVLEGLMKHRTPHDHPNDTLERSPSLEAQIVNIADEIAYTAHDCEDGLRAHMVTLNEICSSSLIQQADQKRSARNTPLRGSIIDLLVTDLYEQTETNLNAQQIKSLDDVYEAQAPIVTFSEPMQMELKGIRDVLWNKFYMHDTILKKAEEGKNIVTSLCTALLEKPNQKVVDIRKRTDADLFTSVKDYVAGMTDGFAKISM